MSIEVRVQRRLGAFSLDANFTAGTGITALFGRSGAGKTSIVNMVAGLVRPDAGRIVAGGRVLFDTAARVDLPVHARRVGYVFQEPRLFPHLSVAANLRYGRWFTPRTRRRGDEARVLDMLGIGHLLGRRPGSLSGGEKQRVAIGRALLASPAVLLMDEPLASLDGARKAEILPYLERLRDETALPVLYVSHSIDEVTRLADTLVLVSDGRVAAAGPVDVLMGRPDLHPLAGRYEAGAVIDVRVAMHDEAWDLTHLAFAGGTLRVPRVERPVGSELRLRVRARDVSIAPRPVTDTSIRNCIPARVTDIALQAGAFAEVSLDAGGAVLLARITRNAANDLSLVPGMQVWALVKSVAVDRRSLG